MVYAMMSIGVLGFVVWSWILASPHSDMGIYNFAVSWNGLVLIGTLNGKNSISYTQSAGNLSLYSTESKIQSASETIRVTSFNFSAFRQYYNTLFGNTGQHLSCNWLTWFIGFVEGDGAIQTYGNGTRVRLVLTQKESAILYYIQKKLGIGIVKHFPQGTSGNKNDFYRWIVDNPSHILLLAFLFNSNLALTHRIQQLSLWVQPLNNRFGANTILLISPPVTVTLQDAWLSGFTDAEGCFNASITSNPRYTLGNAIKMRYLLDQKDSSILLVIRDLFGFGNVNIKKADKLGTSQINNVKRVDKLNTSQLNPIKLDPWFLTGFTDAEGSFMINVRKSPNSRLDWAVKLIFQIELHKKDKDILNFIQAHFQGVGTIYKVRDCLSFRVSSIDEIVKVILPHFDSYPLKTLKHADYLLFKEVALMMKEKKHLTQEGWDRVLALRASSNKGLSDELKVAFPTVVPAGRQVVQQDNINPYWLSGFVSGDGCFFVSVYSSSSSASGFKVKLTFKLTQHIKDEKLLRSLVSYLGCGSYYITNPEVGDFLVTNFLDLKNKVIPFFKEYPLLGIKSKDFQDFCKAAELVEQKKHLTEEGLDQIRKIKAGMNKGRISDSQEDNSRVGTRSEEEGFSPTKEVTLRFETNGVYRYTATGFKSMNHVISYFKVFPLLTKKGRSFDKWLDIHDIVYKKLHLTEEGLAQVRVLQKQINIDNGMTKKTGSAHP